VSPRIPYASPDLPQIADLVAAIRARRGGTLLNLDRMLLHSPPFAAGWNGFLKAVRGDLLLDARQRELAICAVAALNGAEYEFHQHAPEFLKAGGTPAQLDALRDPLHAVNDVALFTGELRAVLQLSIEMTRAVQVSESTFTAIQTHLDQRRLVELVGVIAAYNMVSRILVALGVEPERG
jgi:alkylhydroperoxidase family enzyme